MSKSSLQVSLACLLLLTCTTLISTPAFAQSQASTGQIAGVVKDTQGAVVGGATVQAINLATDMKASMVTGSDGLYRLVLLPAGKYKITATAQGFGESVGEVSVGVGRTIELNFTMAVGAHKEEITVRPEMIETTRNEEAAFVDSTVVGNIPLNGRRFLDITSTTPTGAVDPQRGGITLTGQRMVNTGSINLDGTDYGQLFFGGIRGGERAQFAPTIPLDSVQEFQVIRAGYTAEFGHSTGGVITAVTKSGTNAFHGSGYYSIRPDSTALSNEFYDTIQSQRRAQGCTTCVVNPNPTLQQWGGTFGGPIKKDKLFFFGAYDQQRQRLPHVVFFPNLVTGGTTLPAVTPAVQEAYDAFVGGTYVSPTAGTINYPNLQQPFTQTNDAWMFLAKADYQLSNRSRLSMKYTHSNYQGIDANSVGTSLLPNVSAALSNNGTELDSTRNVAGNLNTYFSGHLVNEFRGEYARETRPRLANAESPTFSNSGVGSFGTVSFLPTIEYDYRIQFTDSLTMITGSHTFKYGAEYSHLYANQFFGFNQFGAYSFSSTNTIAVLTGMGTVATPTLNPLGNRFDVNNSTNQARYNLQVGNLFVDYPAEQVAAFIQDSWRLKPNFTVNYGLRWEAAFNPTSESAGTPNSMVGLVQGFNFPDGRTLNPTQVPNQLHQFAPRLGFAWDPKGDGKTVFRAFSGIYFAATPQILYSNTVGDYRNPPANLSVQLPISNPTAVAVPGCPAPCNTVYDQFRIVGINLNTYPLNALPTLTPSQITTIANAVLTAEGKPFNQFSGAAPITTANNYHNPRSYQVGFGAERQLAQGWTVGLEGIWIKTVFLERDLDLNLPASPTANCPVVGASCIDPNSGRPLYGVSTNTVARPILSLGQVIVRDSTAKALYRGATLRTSVNRKWGQINAYYTLSENLTDDDNERTASGAFYQDPYNFAPDYSYSNLNVKHQFVAQPVFFLPKGVELSSAIRLLSGTPLSAIMTNDTNQDGTSNDRPYLAVGEPFKRNSLHNRALTFIDFRAQKSIPIKESKQIRLSAELFNLFNFMNLQYSTASPIANLCTTTVVTCGIPAFQGAAANGWTLNPTFLQLRNPTTGLLNTSNSPATGATPFEAQFSARFIF
jgi:carboxypeptidase family protein